MPKITAKIHTGQPNTLLLAAHGLKRRSTMFAFTPPPAPETTPTPCPQCTCPQAIAIYATARTEYFRCVGCGGIWTLTREELNAPSDSAAA